MVVIKNGDVCQLFMIALVIILNVPNMDNLKFLMIRKYSMGGKSILNWKRRIENKKGLK